MTLRFSKMHGLGNDFMVIDAINQNVSLTPEQLQFLGDRHRGVGFDPGVDVERLADSPVAQRTEFIADFYSEKYASHDADFYVCKMTLEHIHPTGEFIATVRRAIGDRTGTTVFVGARWVTV